MSDYYHFWIAIPTTKREIARFDFSEQQLLDRLVTPYNEGRSITLAGVNVAPELIDKIHISRSSVPARQLRERVNEKLSHSRFNFFNPQIDLLTVEEGEDITDEYITGAPGHARPDSTTIAAPAVQSKVDPRKVFIVHGRDRRAKQGVVELLRAAGLSPIEWSEAKAATGKATPYIGDILEQGFALAQAVVVILTPDDEARLKERFWEQSDPDYERNLTGQARPNVLFEAGMAMGIYADRTVIVEMGALRPFSDTLGRHVIRLNNSVAKRQDLLESLQIAGCSIDIEHKRDWHTAGNLKIEGEE